MKIENYSNENTTTIIFILILRLFMENKNITILVVYNIGIYGIRYNVIMYYGVSVDLAMASNALI